MTSVLVFSSQAAAAACLADIEAVMFAQAASQGLAVDEAGIIGKNAATGEDALQAARTQHWDTVAKHPTQDWWFIASPQAHYPESYAAMTAGHSFTVEEANGEWYPPVPV